MKRLKERSGSTSDIIDMLKRKRDIEENRREEEEAFRKSKMPYNYKIAKERGNGRKG